MGTLPDRRVINKNKNLMKTFKEFQEGLFDWLPRGRFKDTTTRQGTLDKFRKKNPKFVRGGPVDLTKYNMPVLPQQTGPTPRPSAKNFFKNKGLEV